MYFAEIVLICYMLGSLGSIASLFPRWGCLHKPAAWVIVAGFFVHAALIVSIFARGDLMAFSRGELMQILVWSLVFIYCVTWWRLRSPVIGLTIGPLALALFFFSSILCDVDGGLPKYMTGTFLVLHLVLLSINFALIALGFGSSLFFLNLRQKLKSKKMLPTAEGDRPSLITADRINKLVVLWGFPLFTIGLATGFAWALVSRGSVVTSDPKEVASILLWLLYALVFMQRFVLGWHGKKAALMLVILFVATICSLVCVNIFMDSHHNFFQTPGF